ncbi:beta-lactamase repressor [Paenibacillus montaniterrae]|uniref:Beta-lactamase repressor n=1 Tax=Paenibacillus montaniterrae TaxID=429341 RepID=A0A919YVL6_9BACL|nr:BlaI/MecI/CopY family transcriptional regulator [Paenibacillus montaniterrae]GIP19304.1 beta-lactamase repressor [Paenibacillus montaniterrae]
MNIPNISAAEWEVMKVLWRKSPITAQEVIDQLSEPMEWSPKTVKALINRLLKKGAIQFESRGRVYYYSPLVAEEDCIREERKTFLQRIYGGALSPMLAHFIQDEQLSKEEIEQLKKMLEEKR